MYIPSQDDIGEEYLYLQGMTLPAIAREMLILRGGPRQKTLEEHEWEKLKEGKPLPISIWHEADARAYYEATEAQRAAWNAYAQREANRVSETLDAYETIHGLIGYDRDGNITDWCPPLFFPEWLATQKP